MKKLRLAIVSSHPIQYYAPIFQALGRSKSVQPRVFYTWSQTTDAPAMDPGFGRAIHWDIPLLEGYEYEFVPNLAKRPGTNHFLGLHNPGLSPTIEQWGADAILVFAWNLRSHLGVLRHFKGTIPVFFRGDSTLLKRTKWWRAAARRIFLTWVYRHIDVPIAVGSNNRDYFRWCGVPENRIAFAPHAVDTARFSDPDGRHRARADQQLRELGIAPDETVLLFAAKFIWEKDCLLLLEAFLQVQARGHLVLVGNGPFEADLRARSAGRSNVHFLPFQNQQAMPAVYRLGQVFILPSRSETWGLGLNEAMASGCAVIASSQVGAARDLIKDGVNGWLFEAGSREHLTAVIEKAFACSLPVLRDMGDAARRESSRWSIESAAQGIERAVIESAGVSDDSAVPLQGRHIRPR
jgi:glycosyltransferase involved in cell wall biosynthesis